MERLYLRGIFELSMLFQDLRKMVFSAVFREICSTQNTSNMDIREI